jgi:hypothetical protein
LRGRLIIVVFGQRGSFVENGLIRESGMLRSLRFNIKAKRG